MGDFGNIDWLTKPFTDAMREMDRVTDKATLYGLRAVGRKGASAARSAAPVYRGDDPRAKAEAGSLRKSISNSRAIVHVGTGDYSMKMGPFGRAKKGTAVTRHGKSKGQVRGVQLYRAKVNDKARFMNAGIEAMDATAKATFESAYARAYERFK